MKFNKNMYLFLNFLCVSVPALLLGLALSFTSHAATERSVKDVTQNDYSYSQASGFRLGAQFGPAVNSTSITGSSENSLNGSTQWRTRLSGGLTSEYEVNHFFSIASELSYVQRGFSLEGTVYSASGFAEKATADINMNYIELPVLAKFYLPNSTFLLPFAYAGVGASFLVNKSAELKVGKEKVATSDSKALDPYFNTVVPSFHLGLGSELEVADHFSIVLNVHYTYLLNVSQSTSAWSGINNQTLQFLTGVQFDL